MNCQVGMEGLGEIGKNDTNRRGIIQSGSNVLQGSDSGGDLIWI